MQAKIRVINMCLAIVLLSMILLCVVSGTSTAMAATVEESSAERAINSGDVAEPCALFVDVTVSIKGLEGVVYGWAEVRHALFANSINVVVELYSSLTYQDSYLNMTPESRVATDNLKKGEKLEASAPINGVERYWKAKMYYKVGNGKWTTVVTDTWKFDVDGILLL